MSIAKSPEPKSKQEQNRGRPLGVYVHFPWCLSKCPYCDFFSVVTSEAIPHEPYADAVIAEFNARMRDIEPGLIRSVYLGGGTPSLWDPRSVTRVVAHILRTADVATALPEITIECNPSSFEIEHCQRWVDAGINRLSLGLQSLNSQHLEFLGRAHDGAEALAALERALRSGIPSVGVDLIFGLPEQRPSQAVAELARLPLADLAHISAYALTVEQNTPFGSLARAGRLPLSQEDDVATTFFALQDALRNSGFEHYEISNYAKPACRAVHNVGYWRGEDYLGLGVAAWGTVHKRGAGENLQRVRYRNTTRIARYLDRALLVEARALWELQPEGDLSGRETIDDATDFTERLMLGLRMSDGVDLSKLPAHFDVEAWLSRRRRSMDKLVGQGRLIREGPLLRIPTDAWFLADGTIAELI